MDHDLRAILERYRADLRESLERLRESLQPGVGADPMREQAQDMARELDEVESALNTLQLPG